MAAFNITALADLGYPLTGLEDPLDPRFRAKGYTGTDLDLVRDTVLPAFAMLGAYPDPQEIERRLEQYYGSQTSTPASSTTVTPTTTSTITSSRLMSTTVSRLGTTTSTARSIRATPTPRADERCGREFGNAPCSSERCCSQYGWCGVSDSHCKTDQGCQSGCGGAILRTTNGRCGRDGGGASCLGWVDGECCSQYSWCGRGLAYCGQGCQNGPCL